MHIFLGAELYGKAQSRWFQLQKEFSERFKKLELNEYGSELDNISIISIIMHDDFLRMAPIKSEGTLIEKIKLWISD